MPAIREYFPENDDAASFLWLIDIWWTVVNSKQRVNVNNRLGNAAVAGDGESKFLGCRVFASQVSNTKYTLSVIFMSLRRTDP